MKCARHICLWSTDVWLSTLKKVDFFQVGGAQAEMNKLDPSTSILPPTAWWKRYSMLISPFWFRTKQFFIYHLKSIFSSCKKQELAFKWCQRRHEKCASGGRWLTPLLVLISIFVFVDIVSSCHRRVGRSDWELAAFLEQRFMSRACFLPRFNVMSCSQHRWLERKPELWKPTQGIYLGALWVTSWWNKLGIPTTRLQPCCHSGSGFSANLKL